MKVSELIKELKKLPQDLPVVLSRDEEGNGFNGLVDIEQTVMKLDGCNAYEDVSNEDGSPVEPNSELGYIEVVLLWP